MKKSISTPARRGFGAFSIDPNLKRTHPAHGNVEIDLFDRPCPDVNGHAPEKVDVDKLKKLRAQ